MLSGDPSHFELAGLCTLTCLRVLSVKSFSLPDEDLQELMHSIGCLPSLTDITVACGLQNSVEGAVYDTLRAMANATSLDVSGRLSRTDRKNHYPPHIQVRLNTV